MPHRIIENVEDLGALETLFRGLSLPFTVEWIKGRDRTNQQNKLQFLWAREAAEQRGDVTADEVRCDWKLRHGVPIMRESSPEFRQTYDRIIKPLSYENKQRVMQLVEVTSLMKVPQMIRYLDTIQRECLEQGLKLTDPDPDLAAYQNRYRASERRAA